MYFYTYTCIIWVKRRDNFHNVSKSIDCKLCNDLQYVDIVFITLCFYQVDRVHNTQFIFMSPFLLCLCQCICFQYILCYTFHSTLTCFWWQNNSQYSCMNKLYKGDRDKLNCKFWVKHCVINESKLLSCRCAVNGSVCELCVILYDVMFYCFEILLVYNIVSVMLLLVVCKDKGYQWLLWSTSKCA